MLFTSEQVSAGHPDKLCDQISDAIVTDCLKHDHDSRVAIECMIKDYEITLCGEITSKHKPSFTQLAHLTLAQARVPDCFDYQVYTHISKQSADIALGVDADGAGDQGMVFGYATDETQEMLPIPFVLATKSLELLKDTGADGLLPDAKSQVTYDYRRNRIDTFLISTQHRADVDLEDVRSLVRDVMVDTALYYNKNIDFRTLVNPTGRFVIGGSFADTGVTGRKIVADTYGGACRHGGGAFSGKDPTKLDRSGAYMARKIAKDIIRSGFARRVEVQLAYAIGVAEPVSISVDCFGTQRVPRAYIVSWIRKHYDLTPAGIIRSLCLRDVDYNAVSSYGHFWRSWMPWEK